MPSCGIRELRIASQRLTVDPRDIAQVQLWRGGELLARESVSSHEDEIYLVDLDPLIDVHDRYPLYDLVLLPGDRLVTTGLTGGGTCELPVPDHGLRIDEEGRLTGAAPPSAILRLRTDDGAGGDRSASVELDESGRINVALAELLGVEAEPGRLFEAELESEGLVLRQDLARLALEIDAAAMRITGRASAGSQLQVAGLAGGSSVEKQLRPDEAGQWEMPFTDAPEALLAGRELEIRYSDGAGAPQSSRLTIPALSLTLPDTGGTLEAHAAPGSTIELSWLLEDGSKDEASLVCDSAGACTHALPPGAEVAFAEARLVFEPGRVVQTRAMRLELRVQVDGFTIRGRALPGAEVEARVFAPGGDLNGSVSRRAYGDGTFWLTLDRGVGMQMLAGSRIELVLFEGDPVTVHVPDINVQLAQDAATVSVSSPVGSDVRLLRYISDEEPQELIATADLDERGDAVLPTGIELPSGREYVGGTVEISPSPGLTFLKAWGAPTVRLGEALGLVTGEAPAGAELRIELLDEEGLSLYETTGPGLRATFEGRGAGYGIELLDTAGAPVRVAGAHELRVTSDGFVRSFALPRLPRYTFDQTDATIRALVADVSDAVCEVGNDPSVMVTVLDPSGLLSCRMIDEMPSLPLGAGVAIRLLHDSGLWLDDAFFVPGIDIDLQSQSVEGTMHPANAPRLTIRAPDGEIAVQDLQPDFDGGWSASFLRSAARAPLLRPGTSVSISGVSELVGGEISIDIPEIRLEMRSDPGRVEGFIGAASTVSLHALPLYLPFEDLDKLQAYASAELTDTSGGPVALHPNSPLPLGAGWYAEIRIYLREGGIVRTRVVAPASLISVGGALFCGYERPGSTVRAELRDEAGDVIGTGEALSDRVSGRYQGVIRDDTGRPLRIAPGRMLELRTPSVFKSLTIPLVRLRGWDGRRLIEGRVIPDRKWTMHLGELEDCFPQVLNTGSWRLGDPSPIGVAQDIGYKLAYGIAGSIASPGDGVRYSTLVRRPHITVKSHERAVLVHGTPLSTVTATLSAALPGGLPGQRSTRLDEHGRGTLLFDRVTWSGIPSAGAELVLEFDNTSETTAVPPLSADFGPGGEILVQTEPGRETELGFRLRDGQLITATRQADSHGSLRFGPSDISPLSPWGIEDVASTIASVVLTDSGRRPQRLELEIADRPREHRLWLPIMELRR